MIIGTVESLLKDSLNQGHKSTSDISWHFSKYAINRCYNSIKNSTKFT